MFHRDLIERLPDRTRGRHGLACERPVPSTDLEDGLPHLLRSFKDSSAHRACVTPAHRRQCGFAPHRDRLGKPPRRARGRRRGIEPPRIRIALGAP